MSRFLVTPGGAHRPPACRPLNVGIRAATLRALLDDEPALEGAAAAGAINLAGLKRALTHLASE